MRTFLLLCLFSFLTFSTAYAQYPTNGLVAQYGFDNGNLLYDGANGQNFTQTGASLVEINDRFGNPSTSAITLNGDYLTRPDLDFPVDVFGMDEFETLSFWVKTTTNDSELRVIIDDSNRSTFANSEWAGNYIYLQDGKIGVMAGVQYRKGSNYPYKTGGAQTTEFVSDGAWHHVAMRIGSYLSYTTYGMRIDTAISVFIDGELSVNGGFTQSLAGSFTLNASHDTVGNITVGNNRSNSLAVNNKYFDTVDDILFYNRLLSDTEIYDIANYNFCYPLNPSLLTATSITETEMTINISDSGTFDIAYHKESDDFSNAIVETGVTTGSVTLNGLDAFTKYNFYVRKQCVNNTPSWSAPIAFTTKRPFGIVYVNANANGNNNGTSWANAYTNLKSALAATLANEAVWIAGGTYTPHATDRAASFIITSNNVQLYGGFNGTETLLTERDLLTNKTILSGDLSGNDDATISFTNPLRNDNSYHILIVTAASIIIDGLVFTGGHANGNSSQAEGAAIYKAPAMTNLKVVNCEFKNNVSLQGGAGIHAIFGTYGSGELTVDNSIFENNLATYGTSIYSYTNVPLVLTVAVRNSLFNGNKVLNNNQNDGYAGSGGWFRAVANNSTLNATLTNNTYVNNMESGTNSDLYNSGTVGFSKEGIASISLNATVNNCIFWNNKFGPTTNAPAINNFFGTMPSVVVNNSLSPDNFSNIVTKQNIITSDPLFTSTTDFSLTASSPAVNAGDNVYVTLPTDLLGNQRIFNTTVDMGAYEYGATLSAEEYLVSVSDFTMYPNPTTSLLHIKSHETISLAEIFSIDGKQVLTSKHTQLDVSHFTSGMYLVKITSETGKIGIKKLMKQ